MFNNLIRKNLDMLIDGWYVAPKPILNPCVRDALHCVLTEVRQVFRGERPPNSVAVERFSDYFGKAVIFLLNKNLKKEFLNLPKLSFEDECSFRLALYLDHIAVEYGVNNSKNDYLVFTFIVPGFVKWLSINDRQEYGKIINKTLRLFLELNHYFDDSSIVRHFKSQ